MKTRRFVIIMIKIHIPKSINHLTGTARRDDVVPSTGHGTSMAARGEVDPPATVVSVLEAVPGSTVGPPGRSLIVESSDEMLGSMDVVAVSMMVVMLVQSKVGPGGGHGHKGHKGNDEYLHSRKSYLVKIGNK